jgi:hypothetical protein
MGRRMSLVVDRVVGANGFSKGKKRPQTTSNANFDSLAPGRENRTRSGRKTILRSLERTADGHKELRKLKKVYFNIPKATKDWWKMEPFDSRSSFVQRWSMFMLFPLAYEVWAFPYRLALGVPSLSSQMQLTITDFGCDMLFLVDMIISLSTVLPKAPGREEPITTFLGISRHYFRYTFPLQLLPCFPYWVTTFIVTNHLQDRNVCGRFSGKLNDYLSWSCIMQDHQWEVYLWWISSFLRVLPRMTRMIVDFKAMESNLVTPKIFTSRSLTWRKKLIQFFLFSNRK